MAWRDTLLDYGHLVDNTWKTRSNSDVFSVDGDLMDKARKDEGLMRVMEMSFRPLFQRHAYGGEKMSTHELQRLLRDPQYRDLLPPDKVHDLADLIEYNLGQNVTYQEFSRVVMGKQFIDDASSFGGPHKMNDAETKSPVLALVCRNTVAQQQVVEHTNTYRCCPPPVFLVAVTAVQIALYFLWTTDSSYTGELEPLEGLPLDNDLWYVPYKRREAWRFLSYCLVHDGYIDLLFTVVLQLLIGVPLEIMFGPWRVAIVYISGVLVGSLGQSLTDHDYGLAGGAGGSIALVVGHLMALVKNWRNMKDGKSDGDSPCRRFWCSVLLRIVFIVVCVLAQTGLSVYRRWGVDAPVVGIAAHVGGILAGLLLSRPFLSDNKLAPYKEPACAFDVFFALMFVGGSVVFNIIYTGFPDEVYS